jgi:ADP-heptose:LPS heptosyltransferase
VSGRSSSQRFRKRLNRRLYAALYRAYRAFFPTPPWTGSIPRDSLRRVLIVQQYGVGDMILATPLLGFLREQLPQAEIDVLASPRNAAVIAGDDRVARVFVRDNTWRGWLAVLPRLRARRYDVIFSGQAGRGLREGITASLIACRHTFKVSIWRPKRYQGLFTTVIRDPRGPVHNADRLLHMARRALGIRVGSSGDAGGRYPLRIAADAGADARADAFIRGHGLTGGFVAVNVSAYFADRDWPVDHCAAFLRVLLDRHPELRVVVTPAPGKTSTADDVARRCASSRVVVAPELSLPDLTALVRGALAVITPNTALVHLASAVRTPVVALYEPSTPDWVALWLPLGVPYRALTSQVGGSIRDLDPARVADAFDDLRREGHGLRAVALAAHPGL